MKLSKSAIEEFIAIYLKQKGIRLTLQEGARLASDWMALYKIVKQKSYLNDNENDKNNRLPIQ